VSGTKAMSHTNLPCDAVDQHHSNCGALQRTQDVGIDSARSGFCRPPVGFVLTHRCANLAIAMGSRRLTEEREVVKGRLSAQPRSMLRSG